MKGDAKLLDKQTEVELARELLAGNAEAFDRFAEGIYARLFQYTLMVCGQREDAEEVAQETLLKVFENFNQLRDPEHVRAWVFRIARNACLMKRRKSVFAPSEELSLEEAGPTATGASGERKLDIPDWSQLPEDELLRGELKNVIQQAIAELPPIYKTVLLLRDVEELSTEETARLLDVSQEVVKTRLHRARMALRNKLAEYLRWERN